MNYKEILRTVDTEKALSLIGIKFDSEGSYAKFACPQLDCEGKVAIKEYCERKIFSIARNANQADTLSL
jgi:hypothetical protein